MPDFRLPLSGNVTQTINPWTIFFSPLGSQMGLININLGTSSNPAVLLAHFRPERELTKAEDKAIRDLNRMIEDIADVKPRHIPEPAPSP